MKTACHFSIQNPLEPDTDLVGNISCNFGGDLMLRSGKTDCIYIKNLQ